MIRLFDIFFSFLGLLFLSPVFLLIAIAIKMDSRGGVFFIQERLGKDRKPFGLIKFRSMKTQAEKMGQLTVGSSDSRITDTGKFLRKFKIDELPQLLNVLKGEMSLVGPRPEVPKYVKYYNSDQIRVLNVRPGMTDRASIEFIDENDILAKSKDPEQTYIKEVLPAKLKLSLEYAQNPRLIEYFRIVLKTIFKILGYSQ
jgi:lipopolysaccharide/colanic/teichoic acid biosynthesis glycosyltransferase